MCAGTPSGGGPEPAVKGKEGFPELPGRTPLGHSFAVIAPVEKLWKQSFTRGKGALFKAADRSAPLAQQSRSADVDQLILPRSRNNSERDLVFSRFNRRRTSRCH